MSDLEAKYVSWVKHCDLTQGIEQVVAALAEAVLELQSYLEEEEEEE